jgi:hypothetical protein
LYKKAFKNALWMLKGTKASGWFDVCGIFGLFFHQE